jgi:hypothetical protein
MRATHQEERECPLCDGPAKAAYLHGLDTWRIECAKCTTYEISEGLEVILASDPEAKGRAGYLSGAARRATDRGGKPLKLTEDNYLAIAAYEDALQCEEALHSKG